MNPPTRYAATSMWVASYGHASLKNTFERVDVDDLARRVQREALRLVHPRVRGDHRERAADAREHDRNAGPEVRPRREPLPAEDVDRDEDRLEEEEQSFHRERHAERGDPTCSMNFGQSSPNSNVSTVPVTAPTANVTAMYLDHRCASSIASLSSRLMPRQFAISVMHAHDTPSGTRMM